jgi:hypothetical protein
MAGRDIQQMKNHRLVVAEHGAGGDTKQQGIADLAGGAGDGDANGCFHEDPQIVGGSGEIRARIVGITSRKDKLTQLRGWTVRSAASTMRAC